MRILRKVLAHGADAFLGPVGPVHEHTPELHHVPSHKDAGPWSWSALFEIKDIEDAEPLISMLVLLIVILMWSSAQFAARREQGEQEQAVPAKAAASVPLASMGSQAAPPAVVVTSGRPRKSLNWLGALAAASIGLLGVQLALGLLSGSLTLLADMGHAAGDTVTYFAAYVVEKAKLDLASRQGAPKAASRIDWLGGCASTLLVAAVSSSAMMDAVQRLRSPAPEKEGEDVAMIGPAILTFALVSLTVNLALLAYRLKDAKEEEERANEEAALAPAPGGAALTAPRRPQKNLDAQASSTKWLHAAFHPGCDGCDDDECQDAAADAAPPPPPPFADTAAMPGVEPPPVPHFAQRPRRARAQGTKGAALIAQLALPEGVLPPPPPVPFADAPARRPRRELDSEASSTKWLHAAFHPGCDGCDEEECQDGKQAPQEDEQATAAVKREKNLNLYGATLHLATDVVRSIIVLITGLLLRGGVLTDVARTDAITALVVGLCVLLGSAAFFYAPLVQALSAAGSRAPSAEPRLPV